MTKDRTNGIYNKVFKRILDIFFSFISIILLSPIIVLFLIINCFFTKFHPVFIQKRCGANQKPFHILKMRTLKLESPNYEEKCSHKDYTKIGFFLRRTHIDELLQLLNIFIGQMSFIGPRPIICTLNEQINKRVEDGTIKLRPGLSGLAQVNERDIELTQMEKCAFDKEYLEKLSFGFDTKIVFKSIGVVFVNLFRKRVKKEND